MQKPKDRLSQHRPAVKPVQRAGAGRNSVQLFGPRNPLRPNTHVQNTVRTLAKNAAAPAKNSTSARPDVRANDPRQPATPPRQPAPKPPATPARQTNIQRTPSRVVQAVRFFPNLHPGAVESVNPSSVFRLNSFADQYRLHRQQSHSVNVPNQQYNFVRTREGEMLLHNRYRHPSIAEGKQVLYAGEVFFNNGKLEWWSNGSGHYQPGADDAGQANLPMDRFYSYQQIIKGEHTRKKDKK